MQKLQQIFHSMTKSLEVLYVIEGTKPCARILVSEDFLEKIIDFLRENGLFFTLSDFKVLKQNIQSEFYSDKSIKLPTNAPEKGHLLIYLSKDKKITQTAKAMEEINNYKELGLLLGYPECCCNFFVNNFNEKNTDLTLRILDNSNGYDFKFYNNICARHFDISLLSHFPHSFDCKPSIEIAKNNLRILKKSQPRHASELVRENERTRSQVTAEIFLKMLMSVVVYTIEEGIFLLNKYQKIGDKIIYGDVLTTSKSKLYYLISSNKELEVIDKNNFVVDGVNIKGKQYGIMVFS